MAAPATPAWTGALLSRLRWSQSALAGAVQAVRRSLSSRAPTSRCRSASGDTKYKSGKLSFSTSSLSPPSDPYPGPCASVEGGGDFVPAAGHEGGGFVRPPGAFGVGEGLSGKVEDG